MSELYLNNLAPKLLADKEGKKMFASQSFIVYPCRCTDFKTLIKANLKQQFY